MIKYRLLLAFAFVIALCSTAIAQHQLNPSPKTRNTVKVFPKPLGYVSDYEEILTEEEELKLVNQVLDHEIKTTNQIAIATIESIEPYDSFTDYTLDMANIWGVGQKDKNNGIVIALSQKLKEVRIQTGTGIDKKLTNMEARKIIDELMLPEFKKNRYFEGLTKGIEALIKELE